MQKVTRFLALSSFGFFGMLVSMFGPASYQDKPFVDPDPDLKIEDAKSLKKAEEQRVLANLISRLIKTQQYLRDSSETAKILEMSDDQIKDLEQLKLKYSELLEEDYSHLPGADQADFIQMKASKAFIVLPPAGREEVENLHREMMVAITEILVAHQLESLSKMDIRTGLPKMLVESPIGKMIDLKDEQIKRIVRESNRLSEEIDEFSSRIRKESRSVVIDNLTDQQLKRLREILGETFIDRYPNGYPLEIIGQTHRFEEDGK